MEGLQLGPCRAVTRLGEMLHVVTYVLISPHIRIIRSYHPSLIAYPIRVAALQTNDLYAWA